jgi:hypothetical protein
MDNRGEVEWLPHFRAPLIVALKRHFGGFIRARFSPPEINSGGVQLLHGIVDGIVGFQRGICMLGFFPRKIKVQTSSLLPKSAGTFTLNQ